MNNFDKWFMFIIGAMFLIFFIILIVIWAIKFQEIVTLIGSMK